MKLPPTDLRCPIVHHGRGNIGLPVLALLAAVTGGCTFETYPIPLPPPVPKINSVSFHPQYFCSGEEITVTWDTEHIDKLELRNNDGELLLSTSASSGTLTTPPIDAAELPLVARGYAYGDHRDHTVENLVNIDNRTWSNPIPSTSEQMEPGSPRVDDNPAYFDPITLVDGTTQQVPVYEVHATYLGLRWDAGDDGTIPGFSSRAMIDGIRNIAGPTMNFQSYASGSATIAEGAEGDIDPDWPGSIAVFGGEYLSPKEEFFGWQHGEVKKPPDPWSYFEQYYQEATGSVSLLLYCDIP